MNETIILTGATGFIGSHLLNTFCEEGLTVAVIKRSTSDTSRIKHLAGKFITYDIDRESLTSIFEKTKPSAVFHLATCYRKQHRPADVSGMIDSNLEFPTLLLEETVQHKVPFFINTGTFFEYNFGDSPLKETSPRLPYNLYAASKVAYEEILKFYCENYSLQGITLRLFAPYGPDDREDKLIPLVIKAALRGEEVSLSGGEQRWDFVYVKDIVQAYLAAFRFLKKSKKAKSKYEVFNIGTGKTFSIREIVGIISELAGEIKIRWGAVPYSPGEIFFAQADPAKAVKDLNWSAGYSLKEGLTETVTWYKARRPDALGR